MIVFLIQPDNSTLNSLARETLLNLTSALIISVGASIFAIYDEIQFFIQNHFYSPASFIIAIGVIMLIVSIFGCIGTVKESTCLINIFAVMLSLVLILEVAASIAAYSLRGKIDDMLEQTLRLNINRYYEDLIVLKQIDYLQETMNCCGADSFRDWAAVTPPPGVINVLYNNMTIPYSCCAQFEGGWVVENGMRTCLYSYSSGCLPKLTYILHKSAVLLGAVALAMAFVQLIGIAFSFSLANAIRKVKSERECHRWEIRERVMNSMNMSVTSDGEISKQIA
ncbi:hypothetical protein evm_014318 [Chilo suppressalis]|nr:hypothetical protein evm_014318 [Chilo suppressalis]